MKGRTGEGIDGNHKPLSILGTLLLSISTTPVGVAAMSIPPHKKGTLCPMLGNHLLAARRVYESTYGTRITNSRQAPLSYLGVPGFILKRSLNKRNGALPHA